MTSGQYQLSGQMLPSIYSHANVSNRNIVDNRLTTTDRKQHSSTTFNGIHAPQHHSILVLQIFHKITLKTVFQEHSSSLSNGNRAPSTQNKIMSSNHFQGDVPLITFDLDDNGDPIAFHTDQRNECNFLIEEFMLLANQSVAKFIYEKSPDIAVLRNHAPPKANMMEELVAKLTSLNYKMDISSSKAIANSTAAIISSSGINDAVSTVLNSMIAKPMVRAEYFCSSRIKNATSLHHFALSIPIYTHFTSPIRRYPDILVQRLLAAALDLAPIPTRTPDELKSITRNCNDQKYNAKLAGEDCTNLYFLHYLRLFGPIKMRVAAKEVSKGADLHIMLIDSGHNVRVNIKQNVLELKFSSENSVPTIQFVGFKNLQPLRVNIFDVVLVEVFAKDD